MNKKTRPTSNGNMGVPNKSFKITDDTYSGSAIIIIVSILLVVLSIISMIFKQGN